MFTCLNLQFLNSETLTAEYLLS